MILHAARSGHRFLIVGVLSLVFPVLGCGGGEGPGQVPAPAKAPGAGAPGRYEEVQVVDGGMIEGVVLLEGEAPASKTIRVARPSDQTVCGTEKISDALVVGPAGEVRDVVVTLDGIRQGKPLSQLSPPPPVDQEHCEYIPHVAIYPAGVPLDLRSSDPLLHNVHAYQKGGETLFNIAMPRRGMKLSKPLPPGGWVTLKCDVHAWMNGAIWITDHPYVATTDATGRFGLAEVPPGKHSLKLWHPVLGEAAQEVEVQPGGTSTLTLRMGSRH